MTAFVCVVLISNCANAVSFTGPKLMPAASCRAPTTPVSRVPFRRICNVPSTATPAIGAMLRVPLMSTEMLVEVSSKRVLP